MNCAARATATTASTRLTARPSARRRSVGAAWSWAGPVVADIVEQMALERAVPGHDDRAQRAGELLSAVVACARYEDLGDRAGDLRPCRREVR